MSDEQLIKKYTELITELNNTTGTNAKKEILKNCDPILIPLLERIFDPNTTTGVTKVGLIKWGETHKPISNALTMPSDQTLYQIFDDLVSRKITGDLAKGTIIKFIEKYPAGSKEELLGIFEKKPRIRINSAVLLQVYPDLFKIFKVALALDYTKKDFEKAFEITKYSPNYSKIYMSKKIDGMRVITIFDKDAKDNKNIKCYSRAGNLITSLSVLEEDLKPLLNICSGYVLDGELVALDQQGNENFKETVSQGRRKGVQMINPQYRVFDIIPLGVFENPESKENEQYGKRLEHLKTLKPIIDKCKNTVILEQTPYTLEAFETLKKVALEQSWEGIMLRFDVPYENKRSRFLLKYKFQQNEEYLVHDVTIENMPFPNAKGGEEIIRAVKNAIIKHKDNDVFVGSGFSKEERIEFAKDKSKIVGHLIYVQYQEEFYDDIKKQYSLRCPIFKGLKE